MESLTENFVVICYRGGYYDVPRHLCQEWDGLADKPCEFEAAAQRILALAGGRDL